MRLTTDLINQSLSYLNPLKERELDLRGVYLPEKNRCYTCVCESSIDSESFPLGRIQDTEYKPSKTWVSPA